MKPRLAWHEDPAELKRRRNEADLSAEQLAERSGKSLAVVKNIESGRTKLRGKTAATLWDAVSCAQLERKERLDRQSNSSNPSERLGILGPVKNAYALHYRLARQDQMIERLQALMRRDDELIAAFQEQDAERKAEINQLRKQLAEMDIAIQKLREKSGRIVSEQGEKILSENDVSVTEGEKHGA